MGGSWATAATAYTSCWADICSTSTSGTSSSYGISDLKGAWKKYVQAYPTSAIVEVIPRRLPAGKRTIEMPDGAKLEIDDAGNYRIEDANAKVTYQSNRIRDFSPHLNASDMVAKFIEYVARLGVRRDEMLKLPLHLFINWLIIEAAERDSDPIPDDVIRIEQHPQLKAIIAPKCLGCGRFIKRLHFNHGFPFCSPEHGAAFVERNTPKIEGPARQAVEALAP